MDEEMDVSSDSFGVPSTPPHAEVAEGHLDHAMDVSPVLGGRSSRTLRTPQTGTSRTGWMNTSLFSSSPSFLAHGDPQESHHEQQASQTSSPFLFQPPLNDQALETISIPEPSSHSSSPVEASSRIEPPASLDHVETRNDWPVEIITHVDAPRPLEPTEVITIHRPDLVIIEPQDRIVEEIILGAPHPSDTDGVESAGENSNAQQTDEGVPSEVAQDSNPASDTLADSAAHQDSNDDSQDEAPAQETVEGQAGTSTLPGVSASQDVENLPLAQRIRSPEAPPDVNPSPPKKLKQEVDVKAEDSDGEEEGKLCPICFDVWSNSGEHRLVSLRCGHLFGLKCIQHWLQIHKANDRRCPQCKKKASVKDIRNLYAAKIRVLDTSETEELKATVERLKLEKEQLTRELMYERQLNHEAMKVQREQQMKLQQLQSQGLLLQFQQEAAKKPSSATAPQIRVNMTHRVEVCREGGCRVMAFNEWKGLLVASQSSANPLFPAFGIRMIDTAEFRLRQLMPMHSKAIRDLAFNQSRKDLLLSASLDRTAKVFCLSTNAAIISFNTNMPLWSCCWDTDNANFMYVGSQSGIVLQYDIRNASAEVNRFSTQGDLTPVVSLASVPACEWLPRGGFLSCRLNRLRVYEQSSTGGFSTFPMDMDGPFTALNYDHKTQHMLLSTRPSTQAPHAQHQLYQMTSVGAQPKSNLIHSFLGGTTQRVMSRPCQLNPGGNINDTLVCAHQESEGHVAVWSAQRGCKLQACSLPSPEPVMDLCPVGVNEQNYLASLSDKSLRVYQFS